MFAPPLNQVFNFRKMFRFLTILILSLLFLNEEEIALNLQVLFSTKT